jgi:hypothetical protein
MEWLLKIFLAVTIGFQMSVELLRDTKVVLVGFLFFVAARHHVRTKRMQVKTISIMMTTNVVLWLLVFQWRDQLKIFTTFALNEGIPPKIPFNCSELFIMTPKASA